MVMFISLNWWVSSVSIPNVVKIKSNLLPISFYMFIKTASLKSLIYTILALTISLRNILTLLKYHLMSSMENYVLKEYYQFKKKCVWKALVKADVT